jgi:hypothetical protein
MIKHKIPDICDNQWVYPTRKDFKFVCCDCGLVHSMDFETVLLVPTGKMTKGGAEECQLYRTPQIFSVRMRARRARKMTKEVREQREKDGRTVLRKDRNPR